MADLVANDLHQDIVRESTSDLPERDANGRLLPGAALNPRGRPKGSKNALGQAFVDDLYQDWQVNGAAVIETVRTDKPDVYLKVIAQIIPRDIDVNVNVNEMTPEQIIARIRQLDKQLQPIIDLVPVNDD